MQIADLESKVFMAPMAGITDRPFRTILAECGGGNLISEMVAVNAIQRKNPKSYQIADVKDEPYPVTVQMVGNNPELFADAAQLVTELGAHSIDINMGCPVKKIVNNNSGSALMKDPNLAAQIIKATVKATPIKVSVKFRKGWDEAHVNAIDFAKMCEDAGASYITVHGRTRAQGYSGTADWKIITAVKQAVSIPVIGNGDIVSPEDAKQKMEASGVDGVMIGRAMLGNPWLLDRTDRYLRGLPAKTMPTTADIHKMLLKHLHLLINYYGERGGIAVSRKFISWYVHGLYEAKKFRELYTKITELTAAENLINEYFEKVQE